MFNWTRTIGIHRTRISCVTWSTSLDELEATNITSLRIQITHIWLLPTVSYIHSIRSINQGKEHRNHIYKIQISRSSSLITTKKKKEAVLPLHSKISRKSSRSYWQIQIKHQINNNLCKIPVVVKHKETHQQPPIIQTRFTTQIATAKLL